MKTRASVVLVAFVVLAMMLLAGGCAGVSVTRVRGDADYREGILFYRPAPYLLVTQGREGLAASVIYLPDVAQQYVFRVRQGLGNVTASAKFDGGWNLTELGDSRKDNSADLLAAVGGLGKVAAGAVATTVSGLPGNTSGVKDDLTPGLYRIRLDPVGGARLERVAIIEAEAGEVGR